MLKRSEYGKQVLAARFYGDAHARCGIERAERKRHTMATNGVVPQREKVIFTPNIAVRLALKYATPKIGTGPSGEYALFTTTDNRVIFLDLDTARQITSIGVKAGQDIDMTMYWSGKRGDPKIYQVAAVAPVVGPQGNGTFAAGAPARSAEPETDLERDLRKSVELVNRLKQEMDDKKRAAALPRQESAAPTPARGSGATQTPHAATADSTAAAAAASEWDQHIEDLTMARLEIYARVCERAAAQFGGLVDKATVQSFLMNVLIEGARSLA